ncbi:MAG: hypothetical protein ACLSGV_10490 [Eubacterium sp.]
MSKRNKISLGTPTEELPEWTLSLDFTESQDTIKEEKKPENTISSESTFSEPSPRPVQPAVSGLSSGLGGGLNTEFVIGNDDSASDDNSFSEPLPAQNNFATENVLDFGGDTLSTQDTESITTLDISDDTEKADSILNIGQPEPQPAPKPVVEAVPEPEPQPAPEPVIEAVPAPEPQPAPEPVIEAVPAPEPQPAPEPVIEAVPEPEPQPTPEPVVEAVPAPEPQPAPEPVIEAVPEPEPQPAPEPVIEAVPAPEPQPAPEPVVEVTPEPVDVDSQLSDMANSIVSEENEEQILSTAADLLKNEQNSARPEDIEIIDEMDHSTSENTDDVLALLKQLDVSENLERMQSAAQEDIADVIKQTEVENELETAVPVENLDALMPEEPQESANLSDLEPVIEEPVSEETPVQDSIPMEKLDALMPEEPQESANLSDLEPVIEEPKESQTEPVMEITNDMFDMGYDLDDEPQYSEENIDLSAFQGSIKDAEEINKPASDALDLDAAEADSTSSFDMSNLVAAAMNTLTHHEEENSLAAENEETSENNSMEETEGASTAETAAEPEQPDPSKLEKATLDFSKNDDESPDANLDFGEDEEETLSNLDFVVEEEPEEANLDFESDFEFDPDANLDFTEEEEENPDFNLDYQEDDDPFAETSPEFEEETPEVSFETEEPEVQPEAEPAQEPLLEPDLTFESGLQPEFKEEPQSEPEAQLHFEQEPQLQPEVADYQFEADLDTENAIESLIPPMDDTLSHQLDEVMTESQGIIAAPTIDETDVESIASPPEPVEEVVEPEHTAVSSDTEPEAQEPAQEEVPFTLHFEPVNPDQGSSFAEEMNDFDDVSSLIIEDYNEVPTVSSLEKNLKKQEKEKKKNRKKNAKKKDEGFSLSLDEMDEKQASDPEEKEKFKYSSSIPIRSTNMPEVAKPKEEPAKPANTREASSQTAVTGLEGISKIQSVTPEMLAEERKEVEHLEDVHTHHEEKVYAEKNIYDNGTFQREYYQLYYQ